MYSTLARTQRLTTSKLYATCYRATRQYSDKRRPPPSHPRDGQPAREDDWFQYDMKAPLLDAGFANVFEADPNMVSITENLTTGFRLSTGHTAYGPLLMVNNTAFTLKIPPPTEDKNGTVINPLAVLDPGALRILDVARPKPELLVVGGGANISQLSPRAKQYLTSIGLQVVMSNTRFASSTFNTLLEEGRSAALLALPCGVCI
ncbi:hypothetical protein LPJ77_003671 [Coemansia sp. RSA 2523]|nr:hypothetical protein LPJ69_000970 [Coemansia sp. RSA 1752]KAJ1776061.1 hypothetical protein LPJ54_003319 [Coemansia sp. RSA 1824]KAJ1786556.1 hypothetical protein LPJ62_003743 [Coemansia sp. RSA 2167]KAJ1794069.1 hypothetical protein LPJ67_000993 [Coemansia sp. RSA 1938]KAJ1806360.1 hypothetical protein LPJ77_003671 [Coemansia sp. RSA 2523]KAJ2137488.1 hypothetical protein J3F82_006111 [Coemansia sp. RSA 637]KAJ2139882.1 hypothetical protein GGH17_000098 [Coemansia sp. RSA 788]KAJ2142897.